jgi:hypothetical protein
MFLDDPILFKVRDASGTVESQPVNAWDSFERGTYIEANAESLTLWNVLNPRETILRFVVNCFRFSGRIEIGHVRIVES